MVDRKANIFPAIAPTSGLGFAVSSDRVSYPVDAHSELGDQTDQVSQIFADVVQHRLSWFEVRKPERIGNPEHLAQRVP